MKIAAASVLPLLLIVSSVRKSPPRQRPGRISPGSCSPLPRRRTRLLRRRPRLHRRGRRQRSRLLRPSRMPSLRTAQQGSGSTRVSTAGSGSPTERSTRTKGAPTRPIRMSTSTILRTAGRGSLRPGSGDGARTHTSERGAPGITAGIAGCITLGTVGERIAAVALVVPGQATAGMAAAASIMRAPATARAPAPGTGQRRVAPITRLPHIRVASVPGTARRAHSTAAPSTRVLDSTLRLRTQCHPASVVVASTRAVADSTAVADSMAVADTARSAGRWPRCCTAER
jgi:hypothetical protein